MRTWRGVAQQLDMRIEERLHELLAAVEADATELGADERTTVLRLRGFSPDLAGRYYEYLRPGAPRQHNDNT